MKLLSYFFVFAITFACYASCLSFSYSLFLSLASYLCLNLFLLISSSSLPFLSGFFLLSFVALSPPPLSFISSSLKKQLWRLTAWTMSPDLKNLISGAGLQVPHMSNCMWLNIMISSYLPSMSHNFCFKLRTPCLGLCFFFTSSWFTSFLLSYFLSFLVPHRKPP